MTVESDIEQLEAAERTGAVDDDVAARPRRPARIPRAALRTVARRSHLLLPAVLTAALALRAGGFFPAAPAMLAIAMALLIVGRITLAERPFAGWSPALAVSAGALALFAAWTLVSASWSDAPLRAMVEFDRVLAYLLVLAFMGSFATHVGDLDRVLRWVALAIGVIVTVALVTRLYPDTFPTVLGKDPSRLSFPLTYWNALGVFCAVGMTLALHCAAGVRSGPIARVLGAGVIPVAAAALYLTFSRGGIAAAAIGVLAYIVLGHPRRLPVALLATAVPVFIAVRAAYGTEGLSVGEFALLPDETRGLAATVAGCAVAAMALRALGLLADRRLDAVRVTRRARRTVLIGAGCAGLAVLAVGAVVTNAPDRIDDRWRAFAAEGSIGGGDNERDRLGELGLNGRVEHWKVAWDAFEREPVTGTGAGTYRFEWERDRTIDLNVVDGHSLYIEVLSELGWPGLALILAVLLVPLGVAARRLLGPERHAHAAFLAAGLALLVHAGFDWDWEMPALFAWFFGAAGIACAARADRVRLTRAPVRLTRVVAGLGCLLLTIGPASVAASQRSLDAGTRAFKAGDCPAAADAALDSLDALSVRPEPFELLGYCNLRAGREDLAVRAFTSARERDPQDWVYAYGLAVAQALAGTDPRPMAREARRLNPRDVRPRELAAALRDGGPRRWARAAARARVPFS